MPRMLSKQIIIRVDHDLKVLADTIMKVRGETQQEVLNQAYIDYILKHVGSTHNRDELLHATYTYVTDCQREYLTPLLEKMEEFQVAKAAEEAKQVELMELYHKVMADRSGKKLLCVLVKRLDYPEQFRAFSDLYTDNEALMKRLFEIDDDNEIIKTSITLARIHTTQI